MLIAYVARSVDWTALGLLLRRVAPGWVLLGSALTPLLIATLTIRWRIFLRQQRIQSSFSELFSLTWAGQFFNSILPGSTGGDVVKIYQLCRVAPDRKAAAAATVVADRLAALMALLLMAAIAFVVDPLPLRLLSDQQVSIGAFTILMVMLAMCGGLIGWLLLRRFRSTQLVGRIGRTLAAAKNNLGFNLTSLAAFAVSLGLHGLNFFIFYCFAQALNVTISYGQVLLMMPVLFFLVMMPVTINGHGLRELLLIGYFTHMGVTAAGQPGIAVQEIAVGVSLLGVANELLWSIPGGVWYLMRRPSREPRESSAMKSVDVSSPSWEK